MHKGWWSPELVVLGLCTIQVYCCVASVLVRPLRHNMHAYVMIHQPEQADETGQVRESNLQRDQHAARLCAGHKTDLHIK
jgi:hypothetical protein